MCHQHTDLRVKMPPFFFFFELSYVNFEQVGDTIGSQQLSLQGLASQSVSAGKGRLQQGVFLCNIPHVGSFVGFPLRSQSFEWRDKKNLTQNVTQEPTGLAACCLGSISCGLERRPFYVPSIWPLSSVDSDVLPLPLLHCYSTGFIPYFLR